MNTKQQSRRKFVKQAAYVTPAILTLSALPQYAKAGSTKGGDPTKPGRPSIPPPWWWPFPWWPFG